MIPAIKKEKRRCRETGVRVWNIIKEMFKGKHASRKTPSSLEFFYPPILVSKSTWQGRRWVEREALTPVSETKKLRGMHYIY